MTENVNIELRPGTDYGELLRSPQWIKRRDQILIRDGYRCLNCGSSEKLEVHHRQYHKIIKANDFRKPWAYEENNLITLCAVCHQAGHKRYKIPAFNV